MKADELTVKINTLALTKQLEFLSERLENDILNYSATRTTQNYKELVSTLLKSVLAVENSVTMADEHDKSTCPKCKSYDEYQIKLLEEEMAKIRKESDELRHDLQVQKVFTASASKELEQRPSEAPSPAAVGDDRIYLNWCKELIAALKRLSFAAQTAGGTSGRDDELVAAIGQAESALSMVACSRAIDAAQLAPASAGVPDVQHMVNRFLGWKLPKDFAPDGGIQFDATYSTAEGRLLRPHDSHWWPIGTNLFNADQAKAMFEYALQQPAADGEGGIK